MAGKTTMQTTRETTTTTGTTMGTTKEGSLPRTTIRTTRATEPTEEVTTVANDGQKQTGQQKGGKDTTGQQKGGKGMTTTTTTNKSRPGQTYPQKKGEGKDNDKSRSKVTHRRIKDLGGQKREEERGGERRNLRGGRHEQLDNYGLNRNREGDRRGRGGEAPRRKLSADGRARAERHGRTVLEIAAKNRPERDPEGLLYVADQFVNVVYSEGGELYPVTVTGSEWSVGDLNLN